MLSVVNMEKRFVSVYLDDILVFSSSAQEHVLHTQQVFQRLLEVQLFVKAEKCEFHISTVSFHQRCRKYADGFWKGDSGAGLASTHIQSAGAMLPEVC